jgi:hypothetical protein
LKAADQYEKNSQPQTAKDKKADAQKIQDDYTKDHPKSKLQQTKDGALKK